LNKYFKKSFEGSLQYRDQYISSLKSINESLADANLPDSDRLPLISSKKNLEHELNMYGGVEIIFNDKYLATKKITEKNYLFSFFGAKRHSDNVSPKRIEKINIEDRLNIGDSPGSIFLQYIVNMKAEKSFANDDGEMDVVIKIDKWFSDFENSLADVFEQPGLKLLFNRKDYSFDILLEDGRRFDLTELSDGYSAVLSILSELIVRMDGRGATGYDLEGVVIIDEIETHLHVELQRKILPFLIGFFPNVQFIVSTHSPFVLSSVEDAVICDLEKRTVIEDLSGYSYSALIESYFNSSEYSKAVQEKIERFESLLNAENDDERLEFLELKGYFMSLPKYFSPGLDIKVKQILIKASQKSIS